MRVPLGSPLNDIALYIEASGDCVDQGQVVPYATMDVMIVEPTSFELCMQPRTSFFAYINGIVTCVFP
jgi:hypothetical protein